VSIPKRTVTPSAFFMGTTLAVAVPARLFNLVAFDLPGYGASARPLPLSAVSRNQRIEDRKAPGIHASEAGALAAQAAAYHPNAVGDFD
jgi:pimeloyl-ACP methyl ester carboxylesterase